MLLNLRNAILVVLCFAARLAAQTPIPVPPVLAGDTIELTVQAGTSEIFPGVLTNSIGYNGNLLGPTLVLDAGQTVQMLVHNTLGEMTTVHWHGLHVAPDDDGGPHIMIMPGETWAPAFPVLDKAGTYWYHPHPHGETMKQVLRGAAGVIIVRDAEEAALALPRTYGVDDVPLVLQYKTFDAQKQFVLSDMMDNTVLANGVPGGVLSSPAQVVRYRLLNGSSQRFFRLGFDDNRTFHQIASDAGLLDAPVPLARLELAPGERAEILVDLSADQGNTLTLRSYNTELPNGYPGGTMMGPLGGTMMGPLDDVNIPVLTIQVAAPTANAITAIPAELTTNTPWPTAGAATRTMLFNAQPMMSMTNFFINGAQFDLETINFTVSQNQTEIWEVTNQSMVAHPLHIHGNHFYVLAVNGATPPPQLRGRKDVVVVPPMLGTVRLITRYEDFGHTELPYMYHCHILSHEDGGMMGQFLVNPAPSGVGEAPDEYRLVVAPNPIATGTNVSVQFVLGEAADARVRLLDATGRIVQTVEMPRRASGLQRVELETRLLARGLYWAEVRVGGQLAGVRKLIID